MTKNLQHGTRYCYVEGCRCAECTEANRVYCTELFKGLKTKEPPRHGVRSSYGNYGCRCEACSAAHAEYERMSYLRRKAARLS